MYREDSEALLQRADASTKEAEQLRRENAAIRAAMGGQAVVHVPPTYLALTPQVMYSPSFDVRSIPMSERARLANHSVKDFPVWAIAILNVVTFGLYPLIHFGLLHDRLPRAVHNDPSAGKAIGFQFIPYYNLYWIFFSALRLCDRLSLQLQLRGQAPRAPRGLVLAACVCSVIPYFNLLIGIPIMWTIAVCFLQSTVNTVAALPQNQWDASVHPQPSVGA
jgi:hypothetical protein